MRKGKKFFPFILLKGWLLGFILFSCVPSSMEKVSEPFSAYFFSNSFFLKNLLRDREEYGEATSYQTNHPPVRVKKFKPVITEEDSVAYVKRLGSHFSDPDGDRLNYSVTGFNKVQAEVIGKQIKLSAPPNWYGTEKGRVRACDGKGGCASAGLKVTFTPVNDPPVFYKALKDASIDEDTNYRLNLASHIKDADEEVLSIEVNSTPEVLVEFSGGTNLVNLSDASTADDFISLIPPPHFNGNITIEIIATDSALEFCNDSFVLEVKAVPDNPVVEEIAIVKHQELDYLLGQARALGVDSGCEQITYSGVIAGNTLNANKISLYIDPVSGSISSFPRLLPLGTAGVNSLEIVVKDNCGRETREKKQFIIEPATEPIPPPSLPLANEFSPAPGIGVNRVLVILANYSDTTPVYTPADFAQLLFGTEKGTMRNYYRELSYGQLDLIGDVIGWVQLEHPASYYGENRDSFEYPKNLYKLAEEAITLAEKAGVDFSLYDNNKDGWVDSLIIVHQGEGSEIFTDPLSLGGSHPLYYDNVKIEYFSMLVEQGTPGPGIKKMGFFAHEYGHQLGMIDLYSWYFINKTTNIRYGLGRYELMAYGSYGGTDGDAARPTGVSPFHRQLLGWMNPLVVNSDTTIILPALESQPFAIKIPFSLDEREYFLLSNHQKLSYDEKLPSAGLFIWHIDERAWLQNVFQPPMESCGRDHKYLHPTVALKQADGLFELDKGLDTGDEDDSFKPGNVFSSSTIPNSYSYDCFPSGVEVKVLDNTTSGNKVEIKFNQFQTTSNAPAIWLREFKFEPIPGKADADALPEPGEELELLVRLMNTGTDAQGVSLQVGTTSPYLQLGATVLSPYPNLGTGDSAYNQVRFRVKVLSLAPAVEVPANLVFSLQANSGGYTWSQVVGITLGKPAVLIVDDDGLAKAESSIMDSLNYLHYVYPGYSWTKWETAKQGLPSLELLKDHQAVVWITGPVSDSPLNPAELNLLKSYLDEGGRLILSSAYLLVNPSKEIQEFAKQYLNLNSFEDANYSVMFIYGSQQNPISHTTRAQTSLYSRKLQAVNYFPVVPRNVSLQPGPNTITGFTNDKGSPVMIQYSPPDSYGVVFSSFGLEHLDRTVMAFYAEGSLMRRMLNAINYKPGQPIIFDCQPNTAKPRTKTQTLNLTGLNFQPDTEFSFPESNILVRSKTYNSPTSYSLEVNVLYNAHPGYHKIGVRNPGQSWALYDRYFKVAGFANPNHKPVAIAKAEPEQGAQGSSFTLSGTASYDDDDEPLIYQWTQLSGPLVTLLPSSTAGEVVFQSPLDYIGEFVFQLVVSDGTSLSNADTVRLKAGNHPPVAILTANPPSGNRFITYTLDGSQSYDLENEPLTYFWNQLEGMPVALSDASTPGVKYFTPAPNYLGDYVFELRVSDGVNLSDANTVRITVFKPKPVAVAKAEPLIGNRNTPFFLLDGTDSYDPEGGLISGYFWNQLEGATVNLIPSNTAELVSFQPISKYMGDYLFSLVVSDGLTLSDADTIRVTVENNHPFAVATASPPIGSRKTPLFTLSASSSTDPDGDNLTYLWTQLAGASVLSGSTTAVEWSFVPDQFFEGDYIFLLEVSDGLLADTTSITINVMNHPPIAVAEAIPPEGCRKTPLFTLSALSSSDLDGDTLSYLWSQQEGATVTLSPGNTSPQTSFAPRQDYEGYYGFLLEVSDGLLSDTVLVRIYVANHPPVAQATAIPESGNHHTPFFTLSAGLSSDQDGDTVSYLWTQTSGPILPGFPSTAPELNFSPFPDYLGVYSFLLEVSDGVLSDSDTVQVTVYNNPPVAVAEANPLTGTRQTPWFNLSAFSSSDLDGDTLSYQWLQTQGSLVSLFPGATAMNVSFTPRQDYAGVYAFELRVFDGFTASTDSVELTVNNSSPVAKASATPLTGTRQTVFYFSGSLSTDPENDPLFYQWTLLSGASVTLVPDDTAINVSFHPNPAYKGDYLFSLNVSDGLLSDSDTVLVNVFNNPPVAILTGSTAQSIVAQPVIIDGSLSYDPDEDSLQYFWTQLSGPMVTLNLIDPAKPSFIPNSVGIYVFQLQVFDGLEYSLESPEIELVITTENNHLPVANAGADQIADSRDLISVCLDGSLSYDPDPGDTIASYSWEFISKPAGSSAVLTGANTAYPCFFDDKPGDYLLRLRVADFQGAWSFADEISVYSKTDDFDGDLMPDDFELAKGFEPRDSTDGGLQESSITDPDGDHLVNVHEYFNGTDPYWPEPWLLTIYNLSHPWEGGFFADADGNLQFGATDVSALSTLLSSSGTNQAGYANIYPSTGETHELDGDGLITNNDLLVLNELLSGNSANFIGMPTQINLLEPLTGETTVKVGKTARIMVEVKDRNGNPRSGVAVIFEVQEGNASLYGGDGESPEKRLLEIMPGINSGYSDFAPCLSADGLEIFFTSVNIYPGGTASQDLFRAVRSSIDEPFGIPEPLPRPLNSSTYTEAGPSLTDDGLYLFFHKSTSTQYTAELWYGHRNDPSQSFYEAAKLGAPNSTYDDISPWISPDGLTMYFSSNRPVILDGHTYYRKYELWKSTRTSITDPFSSPVNITELYSTEGERYPSLSSDELEIVFMSNRLTGGGDATNDWNLWYANRVSVSNPFSPPIPLSLVNSATYDEWTPFLTRDALNLLFATGAYSSAGDLDIYLLRRPSRNIIFYINPNKGRFDLTGPMNLGSNPNSGGRAFIYVKPEAVGDIKVVVGINRDRKRKLSDIALDQIIIIHAIAP